MVGRSVLESNRRIIGAVGLARTNECARLRCGMRKARRSARARGRIRSFRE